MNARKLWRKLTSSPKEDDADNHPERLAVLPYCKGRGIDVGCGYRKTLPACIGIDVIPKGQKGEAGVVRGRRSTADICASGDDLPMFSDGELDYVVARHNLEHYVDVVRTLQEWRRILKPEGHLCLVVPDERFIDTIALDPTHKHCFTPDSLDRIVALVGGFEQVVSRTVVPDWSFIAVYRRGQTPASVRSG